MGRRILIILFMLPSMAFTQNWRNICPEGKTFYTDTMDRQYDFSPSQDSIFLLKLPGEKAAMAEVRVLPNPADGRFSLNIKGTAGNEIYRYTILDPLGRSIISGSFHGNSVTLERNGLPSGLYIILLNDSRGKSSAAVKVLLK
jgi:hypothetical protein